MSGCAHKDPGEFCAACATEATLRGALHELSLIAADTMRGVTDCSTPLFQRVRNIVEMLKAAEAERDAAGAALSAAMPFVPGARVEDRTLADLVELIIAERDEARNERDALFHNRLRLETERDGACAAAAVRAAANEVALREEITTAFRRHGLAPGPEAIDGLVRERDAYKRAKAENDERFMLERDEARAKYADALTVLNALECAAGGLTVHASGVITPADVKAVESWRRIVDDLENLVEAKDEP